MTKKVAGGQITSRTPLHVKVEGNQAALAILADLTIDSIVAEERLNALGIACSDNAIRRYRHRILGYRPGRHPNTQPKAAGAAPQPMMSAVRRDRLGKIADLLDRNGIDVEDVGQVHRVNLYQGFYKDDAGESHVVDMSAIQLSPSWDDGPKWPVVQQAAPTTIRPVTTRRPERTLHTAVILPDPQIGYRRDLITEQLDPFHDEGAMDVALQILASLRPDKVVNLGDAIDFAEFSRFEIEPGFALTTQASLDRSHRFLAQQRASAPEAEIELMEGNHDRRAQKHIIANAKAAFGLRRAECPEEWPVMSIPYLLRLDDLGVRYIEGYPAGITWINDRLACVHGERLKVDRVVDDERISVIQGHIHRIELRHKTRRSRYGALHTLAASPGCLCRIDGAVPSTKGSTDSRGKAIMRPEDWQQGMAVVSYLPGDNPFHLEIIPIHNGRAIFRGREYVATEDPSDDERRSVKKAAAARTDVSASRPGNGRKPRQAHARRAA